MIFMRTDVYFVVQDLTGCANLYTDATAYLRERTGHLLGKLSPGGPANRHTVPSAVPAREQRVVQPYSVVLLVGTVTALVVMTAMIGPALVALLGPALRAVVEHSSLPAAIDGATALLVVVGGQILWMRAWWRRHGHRVLRFLPTTKERR
jgi:putative peptide zinc metalloprotease protein